MADSILGFAERALLRELQARGVRYLIVGMRPTGRWGSRAPRGPPRRPCHRGCIERYRGRPGRRLAGRTRIHSRRRHRHAARADALEWPAIGGKAFTRARPSAVLGARARCEARPVAAKVRVARLRFAGRRGQLGSCAASRGPGGPIVRRGAIANGQRALDLRSRGGVVGYRRSGPSGRIGRIDRGVGVFGARSLGARGRRARQARRGRRVGSPGARNAR